MSLEDGQLLTKGRIFEGHMLMTTEHKNDESNPPQNCVHKKGLCRLPMEESTVSVRHEVLAKDNLPERRRIVKHRRWDRKVRMVRHIEELGPKLQPLPLIEFRRL